METLAKFFHEAVWRSYHQAHFDRDAVWVGRGASLLGLTGTVSSQDVEKVLRGKHPESGSPLRNRLGGVAVYELTFSVPKSVSVLALYDERIPNMILAAAQSGVEMVEAHARTRERSGTDHATNKSSPTKNVVAVLVPNNSNRRNEPQQHVHSGLVNLTFDEADIRWTALEITWIFDYENRRHVDLVCHNALAADLIKAGYEVVVSDHAFEIAGVDSRILTAASSRRHEVLARVEELREELAALREKERLPLNEMSRLNFLEGLNDRALRDYAARSSREQKREYSQQEIRELFEQRLKSEGLDTAPIELIVERAKATQEARHFTLLPLSSLVEFGLQLLDHRKIATRRELTCAILAGHLGKTSPELVTSALTAQDFVTVGDSDVLTTRGFLNALFDRSKDLASKHRAQMPLRLAAPKAERQMSQEAAAVADFRGTWLIISSRQCTSESLKGQLEKTFGASIAIKVLPIEALLGAVLDVDATSARSVFVAPKFMGPCLKAVVDYLEARGAVRYWLGNSGEYSPKIKRLNTLPELADEILVREFVTAHLTRSRFVQALASTKEAAVALTLKIRRAIFPGVAEKSLIDGDTVRATGNNRLGAKRTEKKRLYVISESKEGGVLLDNRLKVPEHFKNLEHGYVVAEPEEIAPNARTVFVAPDVPPSTLKTIRQKKPKASIVVLRALRAVVTPISRALERRRRKKVMHAFAFRDLTESLNRTRELPLHSLPKLDPTHEKPSRIPMLP